MIPRALLLSLPLAAASLFAAPSWPEFRGPTGDGVAKQATALPLTFSETQNVRWKTPIHGRGWSSPVLISGQVWLTTATEDGKELSVVCVDAKTGTILHDKVIFQVENPQFCHKFNSYASPTPIVEAGRVYVTFGSPGTACLDTQTAKVLWERTDFVCNHYRGAGSSPIIWEDKVIMPFDGSDFQYIVALDKKTGQTSWKTDRSVDFQDLDSEGKPQAEGDFRKAFATPHVAMHEGQPILISSGAKAHYAYDPRTGRELWRVEERGQHSASTRPVVHDGIAYIPTGFSNAQLLAVKLPSLQNASEAAAAARVLDGGSLAWRLKRHVPNKPSLLPLPGSLLFMIDDGGIATCVDTASGQERWSERVQGNYSASPILAGNDRIYVCSEEGKVSVLQAGGEFKLLAENKLADGFMASPAIDGNALILRTKTHLYRIEQGVR